MIVWWLEVIVVTSLLTNLIVNSTFTGFTAQKKSNNGILCPPATMTCNRQDMAAPNWTGHWIGDSSVTKIAAIWCQRARVLQISTWHRELGHKEWQIAAIEGWQERAAQMHHGLLSHTLWMAMLHWKRNSLVGWPSVDQIANSFGQLSCWRLAWKQLQVDFAPVTLRRSVKIREGWGQPMSTSYLIYCDILWYTVIYLTWQVTMQLVRLVTSYSRVRRSRRSWLHNAAMQYRHTSACSRQAISQCGKLWQVQGLGAVCQ